MGSLYIGLHGVLATQELAQAKKDAQFRHYPGQIEALHYLDSPLCIVFNALEGRKPPDNPSASGPELLLLDSEGDDVPAKLGMYTKKMTETFIEREPSEFMRPTLRFAVELSEQKQVSPS
jgi:hypothetical protein